MDRETAQIKKFFEDHHIHLSELWLNSCIAWCKEESLPPNYNLSDLQGQLLQQWLLLDLRDAEVGCLPPNLGDHRKHVIRGTYCVQVMQAVDVSKPKHWQLQRIRNANVLTRTNDPDDTYGKRVLHLTLHDGVQEVEAMEYRTIPCLSLNISPGAKLKLSGPITIRRGRLLLENNNVQVLGGEVGELLVPNAVENVLARALNLPLNPNPEHVDETDPTPEPTAEIEPPLPFRKSPSRPNIASNPAPPTTITDDFDRQIDEEIEWMREAEASFSLPEPSARVDLFEDDIDFSAADFESLDRIASSSQTNATTSQNASLDDDVSFDDLTIDAHLDELDKQMVSRSASTSSPSTAIKTISISKLLQSKTFITKGVFKVRARFSSVEEKLTVEDDGYKIKIRIQDGTDELVVKVHTDIVAEFLGCNVERIMALRARILENDQEASNTVVKAMQALKEKLTNLDDILEIQLEKNVEVPVIIGIVKTK